MSTNFDSNVVRRFSDLTDGERHIAGGKCGTLSQLFRKGYPVPEGLIVTPSAFVNDQISEEAWRQLRPRLARFRERYSDVAFAVRSSAAVEDSSLASFAGQFATILNVRSDAEIRTAIDPCAAHGRASAS